MPECNLQNLGRRKSKNLAGYSFAPSSSFGVIHESKIIRSSPPLLHKAITCHLAAQKCLLAAGVDYMQGDVNFG